MFSNDHLACTNVWFYYNFACSNDKKQLLLEQKTWKFSKLPLFEILQLEAWAGQELGEETAAAKGSMATNKRQLGEGG